MIARFRKKADATAPRDQVAARYDPGAPDRGAMLADLREVARMADEAAEVAEVALGSRRVLLVCYMESGDDRPPHRGYEVVEAGHWLAYSPGNDFLYDSSDGNWARWYEQVSP